jgi:serpin B
MSGFVQEMGLSLPFDYFHADFGEMTVEPPPEPIYAPEILHECFVEVNEEGTGAAAATAVAMLFGCAAAPPPEDFVADHPFMFVIKEEFSGVVVFAGQVINPSV